MGLSIAILIFLPYLDKTPVASTRFSQYSRQLFWFFAVDVLWLGFLGGNPIEEPFICLSWIATFSYFIYFILLFLLTSLEKNISDSIVN
jgi:ubiquinol-cytochrome c reductase cytochrome b subunit